MMQSTGGDFYRMLPDEGGFTLIEVLLSITLIGVILVVIFGGFRISINAWETGEKRIDAQQHQQIVLDLMRRQLASIKPTAIETEDDRTLAFEGGPASLACISSYAVIPGNYYGDVYVRYWVEDQGNRKVLKIYENNSLFESVHRFRGEAANDANTYELAEIRDIAFSYLKKGGAETYWTDHWEASDADIPAAVRCVMRKNEEVPPIEIVVSTHAEPPEKNAR